MNPETLNTAVLKVEIPDRTLARALVEQWAAHPGIALTILRGRVTSDGASYELEVQGTAVQVARMIRQSAPWEPSRRLPALTPA
jgi:hypothetical protein